jgi:hypothetical protein
LEEAIHIMASGVLAILGAAARASMDVVLRAHAERKRQILLDELATAQISLHQAISKDELLSCIFQFDVAAMKGAADYKLKLMARVLRGQIEGGALIPDEFLSNSEMISSLREEEIKLVATLHRFERAHESVSEYNERSKLVMTAVMDTLIPNTFADINEMNAAAIAAQRTGLIIYLNISVGEGTPDNLTHMRTTSRMAKFAEIARLETLGIGL